MLPDKIHARHLAQLGYLQEILDESGLATNLLEKSEAIPLHVLIAGFQADKKGRDRFLHFSFLPLNDEEVEAIQLLQMYSTFPFQLQAGRRQELAALFLEVNTRLPIGHFGINDQDELHYRYVYSISAAKSFERDEVLETLSFFIYMCDMFADAVEAVAGGEASAEQVIQSLR